MDDQTLGGYILIDEDGAIITFDDAYRNAVSSFLNYKQIFTQHGIATETIAIDAETYDVINDDYEQFQSGNLDTFYQFTNQYDNLL